MVMPAPIDHPEKVVDFGYRSLKETIMKSPKEYLDEVRQNLQKIQSQGQVSATENALFGMIDGLAGLELTTLERVTALEQRVRELESSLAATR